MYRSILIVLLLFICSCTKKQKVYNDAELNQYVDSVLKVKIPILKQEAEEDFKNRLPIELKFKVDSILNVSYDIPVAPELGGQSILDTNNTIDTSILRAVRSSNIDVNKSASEIKKEKDLD